MQRIVRSTPYWSSGRLYLWFLASALGGYALIGRGFAYVGFPPLYVGEVVLAFGIVLLVRSGCAFCTLAALPNLVLLALAGWTIARTVPFLQEYGIDAVRDSVVVLYGLFSFIVCTLLVERPERLHDAVRLFGRLAATFGASAGLIYAAQNALLHAGLMAPWPNSGLPLVWLRPGEMAVHFTGSAVFALLFFTRTNWVWIFLLMLGIGISGAQSRGGMLAIAFPLCCAMTVSGKTGQLSGVVLIGGIAVAAAYLVGLEIPINDRERHLSVEQLVQNAFSVVGSTQESDLDGTKEWRMAWWEEIFRYTINGPYFWTGKGFGIALAEADGFGGTTLPDEPVLRSPHNVNMTILARAGVPGLVLWLLFLTTWFVMTIRNLLAARSRSQVAWSNLFLFVLCYVASALIYATFEVALEGPIVGIWFWVLIGFGSGASLIFRTQCALEANR